MNFQRQKILIIGMAKSGMAAAKALVQLGAQVVIADQKPAAEIKENMEQLQSLGVTVHPGGYPAITKDNFDLVVTSPGVPAKAEPLQRALAQDIPIWSEIELASRLAQGTLVAITGTNGKTTTTALVGHIFQNSGRKVVVGGNIGQPLVERALETTQEHVLVAEVSSFQLEWVHEFHPRVAVITNITPDHLDRHGTLENYAQTKARIFAQQGREDYTILNYDDPLLRSLAEKCPGQVIFFSRRHSLEKGIICENHQIALKIKGQVFPVCPVEELLIPGTHNLENAMAAVGAGWALGLTPQELRRTLRTFPGVPHRLEKVAEIQGVTYINDSKGTNPDAAIKALEAFQAPIVLIAGGSWKGTDFGPLALEIKKRVKHLVVLGQTAEEIKRAVQKVGFTAVTHVATLKEAVLQAKKIAQPGDVILLSPACASFDMFQSFEHRGEVFKEIVRNLQQ